MLQIKILQEHRFPLLIFLFSFLAISLFGQETLTTKKVFLTRFAAFKSNANPTIQNKIFEKLKTKLQSSGFEVEEIPVETLSSRLEYSKKNKAFFLVDGYYKKQEKENLNIYIQIYNPETGYLIDAVNQSTDYPGLEGIQLNPEEMKQEDDQVIDEVAKKLATRLRTNQARKERRENIDEFVVNSPLSELSFPISVEDKEKATEAVFKLLSEEESISIVSKRVGQQESAERTSAIVSVLTRKKIQDSGARIS